MIMMDIKLHPWTLMMHDKKSGEMWGPIFTWYMLEEFYSEGWDDD